MYSSLSFKTNALRRVVERISTVWLCKVRGLSPSLCRIVDQVMAGIKNFVVVKTAIWTGDFRKTVFHIKCKIKCFRSSSVRDLHAHLLLSLAGHSLDFRKVLRTISSGSGAPGAKLARAFGVRPSASCSVYSVYFCGFCPFQFFIMPIYRTITKNISGSIVPSLGIL